MVWLYFIHWCLEPCTPVLVVCLALRGQLLGGGRGNCMNADWRENPLVYYSSVAWDAVCSGGSVG